jgi:release factor glutamine methyltransferase
MKSLLPYQINQINKANLPTSGFLSARNQKSHLPVEYFTKTCTFLNTDFFVNKKVLIPRHETVQLLKIVENHILPSILDVKTQGRLTFSDIGTGSGILGISLARRLSEKHIKFKGFLTDKSRQALKMARYNADNVLSRASRHRLSFKLTHLARYFVKNDTRLNLIIANLPYIPSNEFPYLQYSVKDHEPSMALKGGRNGLNLIRQLAEQSRKILYKNGFLLLEVHDLHTKNRFQAFEKDFKIESFLDENSLNRFILLQKLK